MRKYALYFSCLLLLLTTGIAASMARATGNDGDNEPNHQSICHAIPANAAEPGDVDHYIFITPATVGVYQGHLQQHPQDFGATEESACVVNDPCEVDPESSEADLCVVEVCDEETGEVISVPEEDADDYLPADDPACAEEEPDPTDLCPNLGGVQETIPVGYEVVRGKCVLIEPENPPAPPGSGIGDPVDGGVVDSEGNVQYGQQG